MATASHTDEHYSTRRQVLAAPAAVADALKTHDGLAGWWTARVDGDPGTVGGRLRLFFPNGEGHPLVIEVMVAVAQTEFAWLVVEAPRVPAWEEWAGTRIGWTIEATGDAGAVVKLDHRGLSPELHCYDQCSRGWDRVLDSFTSYVNTGVGNPFS